MLLEVEEARGALDVRERLGPGHLLPLEDLPEAERPLELANELFEVVLDDTVERHQVAVEVVEHLDRRGLRPHEEERCAAGESLDVALMGRKERDELVGQAAFAAHPRHDWIGQVSPNWL